jgi:hypothetical protein
MAHIISDTFRPTAIASPAAQRFAEPTKVIKQKKKKKKRKMSTKV